MDIISELFSMQDLKYKDFQCKLIPTVEADDVIGIRTPDLRRFGKKIKNSPQAENFLAALPHRYYDENNLHAFLICEIKDIDRCIAEIDRFLPYVDNWATCDMMRPKCFAREPLRLLPHIERWLSSSHPYTIRFGIEMLMVFFLDEHFSLEYPEKISRIESDEYYVNMMIAWYFATALSKQWDSVIAYLDQSRLPLWVHNKTIQKAVESYRIRPEQKQYLRTLKRK